MSSPNRTETIDLPNRVWCVVWGPHGGDPKVFHSSQDFFSYAYVGDLSQSQTLAWPSETEAKIYFEGAGVAFHATSCARWRLLDDPTRKRISSFMHWSCQ